MTCGAIAWGFGVWGVGFGVWGLGFVLNDLLFELSELQQLLGAHQLRLLHAQFLHRLQPRRDAHVEPVQLLLHGLHYARAGHRRLIPSQSVTFCH